ncbi:Rv1355c family protein [Putridiphycobacter roseus]|uniref:Rv1355c family protein n=1 Tax=Putridiphycobacter roseus TaxID=2219161 RepID=A0A2W1N4F9_9FLAO|nr:Rv1355c family protein [Putridiphycobacter roseus]PZE17961.1 Rv1355c family protein [Putridiphycobacter roseus]
MNPRQTLVQKSLNWKPTILNPTSKTDKAELDLLMSNPKVQIFDSILSQISELIEIINPIDQYDHNDTTNAVSDYLGEFSIDDYGVWVYYPWSNRLVHIVPEQEFITLRTNRNQNKITLEEREILAQKKIGLIGLSVGSAVAVTMAMERTFGELRIADFDSLDLSNLNRIRTGVHNIGVSKVVAIAREIMELDPFLNLKCFTDGITDDNLNDFLTNGGNLDVLVDECDSLDIKIKARFAARDLKIPVVMETSDRGLLDVERFDLENDRPILHGLVEDLSLEKLASLKTNKEKLPYVMAIVSPDTISPRAKSSLNEVGKTLRTWPQLASAVALGGGVVTDSVRRMCLGFFTESGRYFVDMESIVKNK